MCFFSKKLIIINSKENEKIDNYQNKKLKFSNLSIITIQNYLKKKN